MADLSAAEAYNLYLVDNLRATANGSQPLAIDPAMLAAAEFHTNDQIAKNTFEHSPDIVGLVSSYGFEWRPGYYGMFENHAFNAGYGYSEQQYVDLMQANLEASPAHYAAMTDPNAEIAGIGIEFGPAVDGSGPTYNGYTDYAYMTQVFGYNERDPFATGFVFTDLDGDKKMDMGEGQTGETVTATNVATGEVLTTTTDDGYWAIELDPNSVWDIEFGDEPATRINVADQNVRLDDIDPLVTGPVDTTGPGATLYGTSSSEVFWGTGQDDTFYTGTSNGKGGSIFTDVIYTSNAPDQPGGDDTIFDFGDSGKNQDILRVPTVDFADWADFQDDMRVVGNDLVVTSDLNDSSVTFIGGAALINSLGPDDLNFYY